MGTTKTIEKNALTEMMSLSVSPSAARDAEVKRVLNWLCRISRQRIVLQTL